MDPQRKCQCCGGDTMVEGNIGTRMYFRPKKAKFFTLQTGDVRVNTFICLDCGTVNLVANVEKLRGLVEED